MTRCRAAIAALLAAIAVTAAAAPAAEARAPNAEAPATASVVGGRAASIAEFPWLAFILVEGEDEAYSCTGAVVAPRVVLTAGHCIEKEFELAPLPDARFRVATGIADVSQATAANVSSVSRAILYPRFETSKMEIDAGLLVLSAPVAAPALAIASGADRALVKAGAPISIAGWGLTNPRAKAGPAALRTGEMTLRSHGACKRETRLYQTLYSPAGHLCALDTPDRTVSGCFGDSGGPAIARRADGTPVEVGIVVSGGSECDLELPNIYTNVAKISGWVAGWVASAEAGAPLPPVPKASPPLLTFGEARSRAAGVLVKTPPRNKTLNGTLSCKRRGWAKVTCRFTGRLGKRHYHASITVFYEVKGYEVIPRVSVRGRSNA